MITPPQNNRRPVPTCPGIRWSLILLAGAACLGAAASPADAQTTVSPADPNNTRTNIDPLGTPVAPAAAEGNAPGFLTGILKRDTLLGNAGGLRTWLGQYGISMTLTDVSDVLGNVSGGIDKSATYNALTTLTVQMDTQKAFGWEGGTFNISGLQIRGRSLSEFYLANLQTVSSAAAAPTTRLWELWYQQAFADGAFDVRLGQQSADQEFLASKEAALYLNSAMGWPMLNAYNLYAGGPSNPLSSLGVRFRGQPTSDITVLAGVFQDNPPGGPFNNDSQLRGSTRWGGNFNLRTGALFIAEVQYALNQPANGDMDDGHGSAGLPGTYKLGAWFDTASFPSQRYDTMGVPLASPDSNGIPRSNLHNAGLYGLIEQMIWRPDPEGPRSLSVFARVIGTPSEQNLISFSANAGVNLKALLPDRDNDTFGIGFGIAKVSSAASGFNQDTNFYGTSPYPVPVRGSETFLEITYQIQVTPWLAVQPDFQYIYNPGGGIANPNNPALRVKNEAVLGVRTAVTF